MKLPQILDITGFGGGLSICPNSTCLSSPNGLPARCGFCHNGIGDRFSIGRQEIVQIGPVPLGIHQSHPLEDAQVVGEPGVLTGYDSLQHADAEPPFEEDKKEPESHRVR